MMMSDSEEDPEELKTKDKLAIDKLLPAKSKGEYEQVYEWFMNWRGNNNVSSFSENVLIVYFEELSTILKPSTMWSHYSMIKASLNIRHNVDINKYLKLTALMKIKSDGYITK